MDRVTRETNLQKLLTGMEPILSDTPFTFTTIPSLREFPSGMNVVGTFQEDEGLSLIAPLDEIRDAGLEHDGAWGKISLKIQSSLSAVGLTAAIASALAAKEISANVVAANFHDHIFVPWDKRHLALAVLSSLGEAAGTGFE